MIAGEDDRLAVDFVNEGAGEFHCHGVGVEGLAAFVVEVAEEEAVVGPSPDLAHGIGVVADAVHGTGETPAGVIHFSRLGQAGCAVAELVPSGQAGLEVEFHGAHAPVAAGPPAVAVDAGELELGFAVGLDVDVSGTVFDFQIPHSDASRILVAAVASLEVGALQFDDFGDVAPVIYWHAAGKDFARGEAQDAVFAGEEGGIGDFLRHEHEDAQIGFEFPSEEAGDIFHHGRLFGEADFIEGHFAIAVSVSPGEPVVGSLVVVAFVAAIGQFVGAMGVDERGELCLFCYGIKERDGEVAADEIGLAVGAGHHAVLEAQVGCMTVEGVGLPPRVEMIAHKHVVLLEGGIGGVEMPGRGPGVVLVVEFVTGQARCAAAVGAVAREQFGVVGREPSQA